MKGDIRLAVTPMEYHRERTILHGEEWTGINHENKPLLSASALLRHFGCTHPGGYPFREIETNLLRLILLITLSKITHHDE